GEGADGSHDDVPFRFIRAAPFAASMAVERPETIGPHLEEAAMEWRAAGSGFLGPRGMAAQPAGEESRRRPLRENDRGEAGFRSDMPNRAAERAGQVPGRKDGNESSVGT